jgi:hypothetical protein
MHKALLLIGIVLVTFIAAFVLLYLSNKEIQHQMTDTKSITREWVEIQEENKDGIIVLRPLDYPIPPARGRRHLDLGRGGLMDAKSPGPTDKLESSGGEWSIEGKQLHLKAPGWEGDYDIEELKTERLILRKK